MIISIPLIYPVLIMFFALLVLYYFIEVFSTVIDIIKGILNG